LPRGRMRTPRIPGTGIRPSAFDFLFGPLFFGPHADLL
jgi:hypothetical protein